MEFRASGDTGLTVVLGNEISPETSADVLNLCHAIEAAKWPGVVEVVPTYLSLLVHYDPLHTSQNILKQDIVALGDGNAAQVKVQTTDWSFPICFEGEGFAPDLDTVADFAGISARAVIDTIVATRQIVYMLGFAPGQPYMGDLPKALALPRQEAPVPNVAKGAVLTATGKTVIYPNTNPTGWHIIGRTPVPLFDKTASRPALLSPGDHVHFHEVGIGEFRKLETRLNVGGHAAAKEFAL